MAVNSLILIKINKAAVTVTFKASDMNSIMVNTVIAATPEELRDSWTGDSDGQKTEVPR